MVLELERENVAWKIDSIRFYVLVREGKDNKGRKGEIIYIVSIEKDCFDFELERKFNCNSVFALTFFMREIFRNWKKMKNKKTALFFVVAFLFLHSTATLLSLHINLAKY